MRQRLCATILSIVTAVFVAACISEDPQPNPADLTFLDMHEELTATGKVLYAEIEMSPEGDQVPSYRVWYYPADRVSRREYSPYPGQHTQTGIITPERQVDYDLQENMVSELPVGRADQQRPIPVAAGPLYAYWTGETIPDTTVVEENHGVSSEEGRELLHLSVTFEALEDAHERPKGSVSRFDVFFDMESRLPARSELSLTYPGQPPPDVPAVFTYRKTELVDPASLPANHFDADALADLAVDLDEAVALAARADFPIFWLGEEVPAEWKSPQGNTHDRAVLTRVNAPGVAGRDPVDGASLWYSMPPDFHSPMLMVGQSRDPAVLLPRDLDAMRKAGHVTPLDGLDGFVYAQYSPRGSCSVAAAQTDPACRMFSDAVYGVVVTIDGTTIHLSAIRMSDGGDTAPNANPFSDRDVMQRLAHELRPIGQ